VREGDVDELILRVVRELREPVELPPGFDARVMAAVRAIGPHARADEARDRPLGIRAGLWLTRPRTLRVRPLTAMLVGAAAAAVFAGALIVGRRSVRPTPLDGAATTASQSAIAASSPANSLVRFVLVVPNAHRVALLGDFNHWDPNATPLSPAGGSSAGVWVAAVRLPAGRHAYGFVVDGSRWVADPAAPRSLDDDFGTPTSTITVASGGGNELTARSRS
jgi:hypothetical protein